MRLDEQEDALPEGRNPQMCGQGQVLTALRQADPCMASLIDKPILPHTCSPVGLARPLFPSDMVQASSLPAVKPK